MTSEPTNTTRHESVAQREAARTGIDRAIQDFQADSDRDASFRILYRSYYRPLKRFFAAKGLAPEDCQDLTQETFLGVYRGLGSYRHHMRFGSWLFQIATNAYRKRLRAAGTAKRAGAELELDEATEAKFELGDPADQFEEVLTEERKQAMRRAIDDLPEQMRKCLTLYLYHELSYSEIAIAMKLKIDTVKAHLYQARRRLREGLGEDAGEPRTRRNLEPT